MANRWIDAINTFISYWCWRRICSWTFSETESRGCGMYLTVCSTLTGAASTLLRGQPETAADPHRHRHLCRHTTQPPKWQLTRTVRQNCLLTPSSPLRSSTSQIYTRLFHRHRRFSTCSTTHQRLRQWPPVPQQSLTILNLRNSLHHYRHLRREFTGPLSSSSSSSSSSQEMNSWCRYLHVPMICWCTLWVVQSVTASILFQWHHSRVTTDSCPRRLCDTGQTSSRQGKEHEYLLYLPYKSAYRARLDIVFRCATLITRRDSCVHFYYRLTRAQTVGLFR